MQDHSRCCDSPYIKPLSEARTLEILEAFAAYEMPEDEWDELFEEDN